MTINGTLRARVKIVTFEKLMIYCSALGITLGEFFTHELFFAELSKEVESDFSKRVFFGKGRGEER